MRLIDADALCKHLHELKTGDKDTVYEYYDDGIDTAISEAATFPTIEAEEGTHYGDICDNCVGKDICDMAKSCNHNSPITACYGYKEGGEEA